MMNKKKTVKKAVLTVILCLLAVLAVVCGVITAKGYMMYKSALKDLSVDAMYKQISSQPDYVRLDDISVTLRNAVIAIEDHRFYEHHGFDLFSIIRAVKTNIESGGFSSGGSTITQQVAKNVWFTQEKKFSRKVAEVFAATEMEKKLSKDEILEIYLNISFFGRGAYGIGAAAEVFFNTDPAHLTLDQSAYLAGLLQAPSIYSVDEEKAQQRYNKVIQAMQQYNIYPYEEKQ